MEKKEEREIKNESRGDINESRKRLINESSRSVIEKSLKINKFITVIFA